MRHVPRRVFGTLTAIAIAISIAACTGTHTDSAPCQGKISVLTQLTGPPNNRGIGVRNSAELAVDQFRQRNPQCSVELIQRGIPEAGTPDEQALLRANAQELAQDQTILGVVGLGTSNNAMATASVLSDAGLTSIAVGASNTSLTTQGWSTFHRILGTNAVQGLAVGRYVKNFLRSEKLFIIIEDTVYGRELSAQASSVVPPVGTATVPANQTDFTSVVRQVVDADSEAVFFTGRYPSGGPLVQQLRQAGYTGSFIGGDALKSDEYITAAGDRGAQGSIVLCTCAPPERVTGTFTADYRARFHTEPPTFAAESFDATNILLAGIRSGTRTRQDIEGFVDGFDGEGVTGRLRFTGSGDLDPLFAAVWAYKAQDGVFVPDQRMYAG